MGSEPFLSLGNKNNHSSVIIFRTNFIEAKLRMCNSMESVQFKDIGMEFLILPVALKNPKWIDFRHIFPDFETF